MGATFDLSSTDFFENPYRSWTAMRERDPVHFAEDFGMWILSKWSDTRAFLLDNDHYTASNIDAVTVVAPEFEADAEAVRDFFHGWMLQQDPPRHTKLRRLITKAFLTSEIEKIRSYVQELTDEALAPILAEGKADLVATVTTPIPIKVIATLIGIPTPDIDKVREWSDKALHVYGDRSPERGPVCREAAEGVEAIEGYFRALIVDRRAQPQDDLLTALVNAEVDGEKLSDQDLVSTCGMLLVAAHETTMNMVALGLMLFLRNPDQLALLEEDPSLIKNAVEEILRIESPSVGACPRTVVRQVTIGDKTIDPGSVVIGVPMAPNHDPEKFPEPERFDIRRENAKEHMSFGTGIHLCIGAPVARLEAQVMLSTIFDRLKNLRLADDHVEMLELWTVRGPKALNVTFDPVSSPNGVS